MFSRYKTQSIFLAIAFFALSVFGMVAYDSSLEIRMQQEINILENFSEYIAKDLTRHATSNENLELYINNDEFLPANYFLIIKSSSQIFTPAKHQHDIENFPYNIIFDSKDTHGFVNSSDNQYTWAKAKIWQYNAILVHQLPNDTFTKFFNSLGLPLIITGTLIMWIVFWATLMLNSVINKLKEKNTSMQHMVLHDALTNLPNRFLLHDKIEDAIKEAKQNYSTFAIIIIDLRRFKDINDTLGHHFGDALLIAVADALHDNLHDTETAARFGGDKFAILIPDINQLNFDNSIDHIKDIFCQSYNLGNHRLYTDASMGVAFFPEHGLDSATLTQRAEMTMYVAKKIGSVYSVYNPDQDTTNLENLKLSSDLRNAIEHQELELYYQPQINCSNGACNYFEALIRWNHPKKGVIMPVEFIPIAENMGLINKISQWVLESAIEQCGQWRKEGYEFSVAVNLSAWDIQEPSLPDRIQSLLETNAVPHSALTVEVTETGITSNIKQASTILQKLSGSGITIALDDFGTGFSSLNHLRHFPIDEVKIDQSFVSSMLSNQDDLALVKGIIDLSHDLNITVVAEGVENIAENIKLIDFNCDRIQGYYYSKPLPANQILPFVNTFHLLKQTRDA